MIVRTSLIIQGLLILFYIICHIIDPQSVDMWYIYAPLGVFFIYFGERYSMARLRCNWIPIWGVCSWSFFGWWLLVWPAIGVILDLLF